MNIIPYITHKGSKRERKKELKMILHRPTTSDGVVDKKVLKIKEMTYKY